MSLSVQVQRLLDEIARANPKLSPECQVLYAGFCIEVGKLVASGAITQDQAEEALQSFQDNYLEVVVPK